MKLFRLKYWIAIYCLLFSISKTNAQFIINGNSWTQLGKVPDSIHFYPSDGANVITSDNRGNLYAVYNRGNHYVAKWNGTEWRQLGGNIYSTFNNIILDITTDANGNLYAAGNFTNDSGKNFIALWDGKTWSEVGGKNKSTFSGGITSITTDAMSNLFAVGYLAKDTSYYVAKWNNSTWSELVGDNAPTFKESIKCIKTDTKGNLYAAGWFTNDSGKYYIAQWDGKTWTELGGKNTSTFKNNGWGGFESIEFDSLGNLYAGGRIAHDTSYGYIVDSGYDYIAKWNGKTWSELAEYGFLNYSSINEGYSTSIYHIITDKKGNLYASCTFYGDAVQVTLLSKWNGIGWDTLAGCFGSINGITFDSDNNFYICVYGGVYKYTPTNLPVKLTSLTASYYNKTIQTNWQTSTELNTANFIIQHSTDGSSFTDIGTVKAIGSGANRYSFIDIHPNNGTNYYRLESIDKDGTATYSRVVSCECLVVSRQLAVYPNPNRGNVTINGNHIASIQVLDNIGRVVKTVILKDATNPTLAVGGLQGGVYHLRVQTNDGKVSGVGMVKE